MKVFRKLVALTLLLIGFFLKHDSYAVDALEASVSNGWFDVVLPVSANSNELRMLEWSTNLVEWTPVARDYGKKWGNTFPYALPVSTGGVNQVLSDPTDVSARYYRVVNSATSSLNNSNSVSRFLQQATFGPTRDLINNFPGLGDSDLNEAPYSNYAAWIDAQIVAPINSHRAFWRERSDPSFTNNPANAHLYEVGHNATYGHQLTYYSGGTANRVDESASATNRNPNDVTFSTVETKQIVWYQMAITAGDVLRQKMAWALSQILVVGEEGSNQANYNERWLTYYDIFVRHAFGNYSNILSEVTFSPHMGYYLTFDSNRSFANSGTFPDENYAREIMQLFTIGLWELNQDGTLVLDSSGDPIPTYGNADITEFAKVFTGLRRQINRENIELAGNYVDPVRFQASWHDWDAKTLLDGSQLVVTPALSNTVDGVKEDVDGLITHLFNHANTPPFVARKLIQRFTVSNPSPQYIYDVAAAFIDNGSGVRGDLGAVVKAILLHPEAREPALAFDPSHGRLREPLLRLISYARAFEITSPQTFGFFPFDKLDEVFSQSPYDYPTVFSFYLPDYQPIGSVLDRDLSAPEFQIHNDITALSLPNAIRTLIYDGISDDIGLRGYSQGDLDLTYEIDLADDSAVLINHLDMMLCAGRLTPVNRATLIGVVDAMDNVDADDWEARAKTALSLFALLPESNVLY